MMQRIQIRRGRYRNNSGFTLIEIIAVVLIIVIVSAVVIAIGFSRTEVDLATQTEVLKSHIRYAQAKAMNTNAVWGVSLAATSYSVFSRASGAKQNVLVLGQDNETINLPTGMTVSTGEISFDNWGQPYSGDTATGTSITINIVLTYNGQTNNISVLQNTGFIP